MLQCCVRLSSSVTLCIVARWCVLQQKLLLTAYGKSSYEKLIGTKMNDVDLCLEVVSRSCQPLLYIRRWISRKPLRDRGWVQRTTNRKWPMGYQMVTWPMTSRDSQRCRETVRSAILATAWLLVRNSNAHWFSFSISFPVIYNGQCKRQLWKTKIHYILAKIWQKCQIYLDFFVEKEVALPIPQVLLGTAIHWQMQDFGWSVCKIGFNSRVQGQSPGWMPGVEEPQSWIIKMDNPPPPANIIIWYHFITVHVSTLSATTSHRHDPTV